jgi:isoleucyl-tRNA synthetase
VDQIDIACAECGETMQRVPEVLDCWFESGSMPYGQVHYPFENQVWFEDNFPADFIVEYIGQTRGWFYTLIVLSSALFDQPPFKNALVHGVLLAKDGRKMSKRLRNFPEPTEIMDTYGADALRLYLMNHPVIDANDSRFDRQGVADMLRRLIIPVWNAFSFLTRYADIEHWRPGEIRVKAEGESQIGLDRWIRSRAYELSYRVGDSLRGYDLRGAVKSLLIFVNDLNNWYIRRSRQRFWKAAWDQDKLQAFETLHEVLVLLSQVMAPLTPFVAEVLYKNLTGEESVHLSDWPTPDRAHIDPQLEVRMDVVRQIASLGLAARAKAQIKVRQPLASVGIRIDQELGDEDLALIGTELNVKQVELLEDVSRYAHVIVKPDPAVVGPQFKGETARIMEEARAGSFDHLPDGRVRIAGNDAWIIQREDVEIKYEGKEGYACEASQGLVVVLDVQLTDALVREGLARELVRHIQRLRKAADFQIDERITTGMFTSEQEVHEVLSTHREFICAETLSWKLQVEDDGNWDASEDLRIKDAEVRLAVRRQRQ